MGDIEDGNDPSAKLLNIPRITTIRPGRTLLVSPIHDLEPELDIDDGLGAVFWRQQRS
jgi:hypothetical protein